MAHSYAPQFRAIVVDQVRFGRRVSDVAAAVEVAEATIYRWVRQDRIDRGELAGTSTSDNAELRAARQNAFAELESVLGRAALESHTCDDICRTFALSVAIAAAQCRVGRRHQDRGTRDQRRCVRTMTVWGYASVCQRVGDR